MSVANLKSDLLSVDKSDICVRKCISSKICMGRTSSRDCELDSSSQSYIIGHSKPSMSILRRSTCRCPNLFWTVCRSNRSPSICLSLLQELAGTMHVWWKVSFEFCGTSNRDRGPVQSKVWTSHSVFAKMSSSNDHMLFPPTEYTTQGAFRRSRPHTILESSAPHSPPTHVLLQVVIDLKAPKRACVWPSPSATSSRSISCRFASHLNILSRIRFGGSSIAGQKGLSEQ